MRQVSILDNADFLNQAVEEGMWHPPCPYCETPYDSVEADFRGNIECEVCLKKFTVEGI